ncbi:MAG: patatin-like phospholipase family protein [Desulfobacteraceae bacterium]
MVGLILEGGAMRAGFAAGVLMAMMEKKIARFDAAIAVSASVPTLAYFASGQRAEMEAVWRDELNTPRLVCYRNIPAASLILSTKRPILDIDYLVYTVFEKKYPLNLTAVLAGKMICHFALTKVPDGTLIFLSPGKHNIYHTFKACLAVPGCYPGSACVDGGEYLDGGTVDPLPAKALFELGMDRVVAVLTKPLDCEMEHPTFLERSLLWRYFRTYDWMPERLWEAAQAYNDQVALLEQLTRARPPRAFIIAPDRMPPARFITRDRKKINQTIDMGYKKAKAVEGELIRFLDGA